MPFFFFQDNASQPGAKGELPVSVAAALDKQSHPTARACLPSLYKAAGTVTSGHSLCEWGPCEEQPSPCQGQTKCQDCSSLLHPRDWKELTIRFLMIKFKKGGQRPCKCLRCLTGWILTEIIFHGRGRERKWENTWALRAPRWEQLPVGSSAYFLLHFLKINCDWQ